jgi:HSP20 family protein
MEVPMYRMYCGPRQWERQGWQRTAEGDTAYQPIPVDVTEKGDQYWIRLSVPGLKAEDIQIRVEGESVIIRGERSDRDPDGTPLLRERFSGKIGRTLYLPAELDAEKVDASLEDGELVIRVTKSEAIRSKTIPIQKK